MPARRGIALVALLAVAPAYAADDYQLGPDSQVQPGVPRGRVEKFSLGPSRVFPGARRDNWIYVPAQYRPGVAACVMVFQDGGRWAELDGPWRVPVVFDNLIHRKEMPITIGVFTNPGVVPAQHAAAQGRPNRSYEYDGMGPEYARFLEEELLAEVGKRYTLTTDPACRAIGGSSSGAIAAFTAAWHRPDLFRRVFSSIGTYVGLRGGDAYPTLVRKSEPRPLRVFLQDGSNDNNGYGGSWWHANQAMLSALEFAGYEVAHVWGDGGHNAKHGGSIFPDAMRFLWKGFPQSPAIGTAARQPVREVVDIGAGAGWQLVADDLGQLGGLAVAPGGDLYLSDTGAGRILRVGADGKPAVFAAKSGGAAALAVARDGRLFAAQPARSQIAVIAANGTETVVARGLAATDLALSHAGVLFAAEGSTGRLFAVPPGGAARVVAQNVGQPSGLAFTPDQAFLYVADARGRFVSSYEVVPDGSLVNGQRFCHLHLDDGSPESGARGLSVDVTGRLFVASRVGLQFCDQAGRVNGIVSRPDAAALLDARFAGPGLATLYAITDKRLFRRSARTRGALSAEPPVKPPNPRL